MLRSSHPADSPAKTSVWALLVASMVLGLFACIAMRQAGVPGVGMGVALMVSAGWFAVIASGALAQKALAQTIEDGELTFALAAGVVLSSMVVLGLSELLQITAAASFVVFGIAVAFLLLRFRRHFGWAFSGTGVHTFVVPCCVVFVLVWCWHSLTSVGQMPAAGTISLWMDIFIHAATVLQYGEFRTLGRGGFEFAEAVRPLYHYGSYVLPAAMLPVLDVSGLQAAVALHLPIGLLAMFAGTHALVRQIAVAPHVRLLAFLAVCLLFILPDTSTYGLANGWFGVRWILMSHPGSGYAIAGVFISLICMKIWMDTGNRLVLVAAAMFAAMVFQLRAHMLLWYLPALAAFVVAVKTKWAQKICKHPAAWLVALVLILTFANINHYLWFVHVGSEPTGYTGMYQKLVTAIGGSLSAPIGFLLLYAGMLGAFVVLYPLALLSKWKIEKLHPLDWFPVVLAAAAGIIIILAPTSPNGDPFEFKHRAFVLLYVVTLAWTCSLGGMMVFRKLSDRLAYATILSVMAGFATLAAVQSNAFLDVDKPKFQWGRQYVDTAVSVDLIAVADFVRRHAGKADTVVVLPVDLKARVADDATRFASISNMPLYISRYTMWDRTKAEAALSNAIALNEAATYSVASVKAKKLDIQWLVTNSKVGPNFDPEYNIAVFRRGDWAAFSFKQ